MTVTTTTPQPPAPSAPERPRRRRHWLRWTIAGIVTLLVLFAGLIAINPINPQPGPLALPANAAAPIGSVDGPYQTGSESVAGFRIQQTVIGNTSDVVGRTQDITGKVTITGGQVTTVDLRVGLLALTTGDAKPAPQFDTSLDTKQYPDATVSLTQPIPLDAAFTSGETLTTDARATLTLHGITRTATVALSARRDGTSINVTGSIPVAFADYGIAAPKGYGGLGSLADHGVAEFLVVLDRI